MRNKILKVYLNILLFVCPVIALLESLLSEESFSEIMFENVETITYNLREISGGEQ